MVTVLNTGRSYNLQLQLQKDKQLKFITSATFRKLNF